MENVLKQLSVPIVGNYYASSESQFAYNRLAKGDKVKLRFELNNKFDAFAIQVLTTKNIELGHLDKLTAKKVCTLVEDWMVDNPKYKIINRTDIKMKATVTSTSGRVMIQISSLTQEK